MFGDLLALAWMNMRRARLRLLMTGAGMVVGTVAVILLVALTIGLQRVAENSVGSNAILTEITVLPSALSTFDDTRPLLNDDVIAEFATLEGVEAVVPLLALGGRNEFRIGELSSFAEVYGIPSEGLPAMNINLASGELAIETNEAIFGVNVPLFFIDPLSDNFEPVPLDMYESDIDLILLNFSGEERVIPIITSGILQEGTSRFDNAVFMPLADVLEFQAWVNDAPINEETFEYDQVLIRTIDREFTNPLREQISALGYETDGVGDFLDELNSFFGTMRFALGATGGIALLVAAFVVANTMAMSVIERTAEIGLMKAVGARNGDVLLVFLLEAGLVGFIGGAIGVGFATLIGNAINNAIAQSQLDGTAQIGFLPINPAMLEGSTLIIIPTELMLLAIAIATSVGLIAGFFPAWRASRLAPVTALRA